MNIDLKKGDIILGGKFKNKQYVFDSFGTDENNQPTVKTKSGKELKLLTFRIKKLMTKNKEKKNEELLIGNLLNEVAYGANRDVDNKVRLQNVIAYFINKYDKNVSRSTLRKISNDLSDYIIETFKVKAK